MEPVIHQKHYPFIEKAIELAQSVIGKTGSNPPVGAVIVKKGKIIGEGATRPPGQDHAEIVAIKSVLEKGLSCQKTTLYVTLEPCIWFEGKRTPGCTDQIIEQKIEKVVIGLKDPNPKVSGNGIQKLLANNVEVSLLHETKVLKKLAHS